MLGSRWYDGHEEPPVLAAVPARRLMAPIRLCLAGMNEVKDGLANW
jgi:hypothetical protein